jgi:hypothetical protein
MSSPADDADSAMRFALGHDAQDADTAALVARLRQPAAAMSDDQLATEKRFGELVARRRYDLPPTITTTGPA